MSRIRARQRLACGRLSHILDDPRPFRWRETRFSNGANLGDRLTVSSEHDLLPLFRAPDELSELRLGIGN
jgi:hypothetical protein